MTTAYLSGHPAWTTQACAQADAVIELLLKYRRAFAGDNVVERKGGGTAALDRLRLRPQWIRVLDFVLGDEPIDFALPAFPCKSPNGDKVAGTLPDEGERLGLQTLQKLCDEIEAIHSPGARVTICSDGHVFADVIGVADATVSAYKDELKQMIRAEGLSRLETFDLRDMWGEQEIDDKRARLEHGWMDSIADLRERARTDGEVARVIRGMTRFLREDAGHTAGTPSQKQREAKRRAYRVLARSRAWGAIVQNLMPRAVRLSIHPQPLGEDKFGISLVPLTKSDGGWTTPWHSVVLYDQAGTPCLVRHDEARATGFPEMRGGRIWCYRKHAVADVARESTGPAG
ncbi:paerucumarin biosynthesis protein PvcA [Mycobacterium timonense]|uniref:Paerucumarin biosynthesis protein PvcA n=2 Tax=Mycobacterium timonense TaxID=701043 RepID=A0A7I9Z4U5_9MYCO|nr:paerucumarin biosynthesis protein PvcA [Mycobacterium timonense]